ncbi:tRNA glutamyl-Q(34) synthetase GluQRS [Enterovirga sp.]|uniref:tRNA glutamyl-Q(34) synthetase GluQRS n=1 Tax=Enterovirga sp. TaxID=2026350 RepID=UPI002B80E51E|nr:tRNA glutamyl-Q(34) synthetase GluQRS [Enterovirga sp.]HMO30995.1 tRNA glutamyl-Q(34) synthetase GluQRS [Enterovirga sp.]
MNPATFRFAPSPNGRLHLGHAYSALLNERFARGAGGRLLLRIEDIDPGRTREEHVRAICEDLAWLGLAWEKPVRRQSRHLADYAAAAERLRGGGLLYPCFCSRAEVARNAARLGAAAPRDPDGAFLYPGTCRALSREEAATRIAAGERAAWRLDMARARLAAPAPLSWRRFGLDFGEEEVRARPEGWGDAVLVRRDTPTSYHLSVVVDDALQGITHVVRGRDLEAATDLHRLLQALLGLPRPLYHHHALVRDEAGAKLAKSAGSASLADLREAGETAESIRLRLGFGG